MWTKHHWEGRRLLSTHSVALRHGELQSWPRQCRCLAAVMAAVPGIGSSACGQRGIQKVDSGQGAQQDPIHT